MIDFKNELVDLIHSDLDKIESEIIQNTLVVHNLNYSKLDRSYSEGRRSSLKELKVILLYLLDYIINLD